jgi:hypothetical protein
MSLADHFFMMAPCNANEGSTPYFWRDTWNPGVLQWRFSQLLSFTLNKYISLKAFQSKDILEQFWQQLSSEASDQM